MRKIYKGIEKRIVLKNLDAHEMTYDGSGTPTESEDFRVYTLVLQCRDTDKKISATSKDADWKWDEEQKVYYTRIVVPAMHTTVTNSSPSQAPASNTQSADEEEETVQTLSDSEEGTSGSTSNSVVAANTQEIDGTDDLDEGFVNLYLYDSKNELIYTKMNYAKVFETPKV